MGGIGWNMLRLMKVTVRLVKDFDVGVPHVYSLDE
jgi:hypothetical protein